MTIFDFVKTNEAQHPNKEIPLAGGVMFNQFETIELIDLMCMSKYRSGAYDDIGRRKPFRNHVVRILNKQRTAEELDTKDIQLTTTRKQHFGKSFIMTLLNRDWMKKVQFSKTLNEMIETRGKYGGLLVKKVINDGVLDIEVVDWNNIITDPSNLYTGVKIMKHVLSPSELVEMKERGWGTGEFEGSIEEAITTADSSTKNTKGADTKTTTDNIEVYEVHGTLPRTLFDEDADMLEYTEQMHVIVVTSGDDEKEKTGVTLFKAENIEHPYKYLPYRKVSRRDLGVGMVEEAFEAQIAINEAVIAEKNATDLASRAILRSTDANMTNNVIRDVQDGQILNTDDLGVLDLTPRGLGNLSNMVNAWEAQIAGASSVQDVNTGGQLPSGTTFRLGAILNQEANSIFELHREEMGDLLREIYTDWTIPHLKKTNPKEIVSKLSPDELSKVVKLVAENRAVKEFKKLVLEGKVGFNIEEKLEAFKQGQIALLGENNKKLITGISDYLKDVEFELDIIITSEQRIKQIYIETILQIVNLVTANPQVLQNPFTRKLLSQAMEGAGYSPIEINDEITGLEQTARQGKVPTELADVSSKEENVV